MERKHFKISRASEYFDPSELSKRTGVIRQEWPYALLKELMDNALDAVDHRRRPEIKIHHSHEALSVWDNGPGMSCDLIKSILDFESRTSDKFAYMGPTRGQQGNAFKTFLGIAYNMGGHVVIQSQRLQHTIICETNPGGDVDVDHVVTDYSCTGTRITISGDMIVDLEVWVHNYHLINPNVKISYFCQGDNTGSIDGGGDVKPTIFYIEGQAGKIKNNAPTSPHWYSAEKFQALCYLQAKKENIHLGQFVATFHGLKSTAKQKKVTAGFPDLLTVADNRQLAAELLDRMKAESREIKPIKLGMIGEKTLVDILAPARHWYKKACGVYDGKPWAFEIMVAECKYSGVVHAVNHSITFKCFLDVNSEHYALGDDWLGADSFKDAAFDVGASHVLIVAHFIGISPEFVSLGKDAINLPDEIKSAMAKQTRLALAELRKEDRKEDREEAKKRRARVQAEEPGKKPAQREMILEVLPEAILKETDNRSISSNKRNLFYTARPLWKKKWGNNTKIGYAYFATILTEYWQLAGRDPLIYYYPRGLMFEPHTGVQVPLGTKGVDQYHMPKYQYNKILYIEKTGFEDIIKESGLDRKYDMAVISTQGYATEAARELMQKADSRDMTIFVFHDCDVGGYEIVRTIRDATKTMPNNNIRVVDLGLNVQECIDMDLEFEEFTRPRELPGKQNFTEVELEYFKGRPGRHTTANGKTRSGWIGCRRAEINVLGARGVVAYLDKAIHDYLGVYDKVIPPEKLQASTAEEEYYEQLDDETDLYYEQRIDERKAKIREDFPFPGEHDLEIEAYLKKYKKNTWQAAIASSMAKYLENNDYDIQAAIEELDKPADRM